MERPEGSSGEINERRELGSGEGHLDDRFVGPRYEREEGFNRPQADTRDDLGRLIADVRSPRMAAGYRLGTIRLPLAMSRATTGL